MGLLGEGLGVGEGVWWEGSSEPPGAPGGVRAWGPTAEALGSRAGLGLAPGDRCS